MEQASQLYGSAAGEEVEDPWGPSAVGWGCCGAPEERVGCPIATSSEVMVDSPPPEARALASAPWSSSHTPLYSP